MLPLESLGYDSSPAWIFRVHAITTQSKQGDIFFTSAKDLMDIGILEEIC